MKMKTSKLFFLSLLALFFCAASLITCKLYAGAVKTGGPYSIVDDSFTAAGAAGLAEAGPTPSYWLIFSAGQPIGPPVGQTVLSGNGYELESGYISGIEAVYQITKTVTAVETPAGAPSGIVPGARINYKLEFANPGEAAQTNSTLLEDPIPSDLEYASGTIFFTLDNATSAMTDALDGDSCGYTATASIRCVIANVKAGATGSVVFKAIVK